MPQLWFRSDDEWIAEGLAAKRNIDEWVGAPAMIVRVQGGGRPRPVHALLTKPGAARVNGEDLVTGIRVLRDRDEILAGDGRRLWFSEESVAEVTLFDDGRDADDGSDGTSPATRCPRCRSAFVHADEVVACTTCGVFYHWSEHRRCFNYYHECVVCQGQTREVGNPAFAWTPCAL